MPDRPETADSQPHSVEGDRQERRLSRAQRHLLERLTMFGQLRMSDGNEMRTARSLVRHGFARWEPPETRARLIPTRAGFLASNSPTWAPIAPDRER